MKYLFLILCLFVFSCSSSEKEKEDERIFNCCSCHSTEPSKSEMLFNTQGGIDSVTVVGLPTHGMHDNCKYFYNDLDYCKENYCQINDSGSVFYCSGEDLSCFTDGRGIIVDYGRAILKIECEWFVATRTDETTIHVSVKQNKTGEERKHYVEMRAIPYCYSGFWIIQSAE
ncbi:MAG: hypothetical protein LBU89_03835 [Fibromonadaceae bacterium]|jgi:hypothetical protein|nr:hypothetical protein [Fibromonadaceae bacterium]